MKCWQHLPEVGSNMVLNSVKSWLPFKFLQHIYSSFCVMNFFKGGIHKTHDLTLETQKQQEIKKVIDESEH